MGNLQLSPGSLFANRFEIERVAGSGGMGTVYRALDRYSGDVVALKLLHSDTAAPDEAERFTREAQLLSGLHHPAIVGYIAHGRTPDGQRFLAMEWLEGHDLGQRLARGPLSLRDALLIIQRAAEALNVAHQRGIIHRDLKPTNLFLPHGDIAHCKLLDFGIARQLVTSNAMTRTGMVVGTPEYMAPEQARGSRDLTPAADIFSLGCVLYECLTGEPPFVAEHVAAVLVRILFEEPAAISSRRPAMPEAVASLLDDMLRKDAAQRVADATALLGRLAQLGELPELPLLPTLAASSKPPSTFAENEQVLVSLMVAIAPMPTASLASTLPAMTEKADLERRAALLSAIRRLGPRAEYLMDGALVMTVPQTGSAQDQAAMAARVALFVKERWSEATVAVTTGRGTAQGATAVGEVADRAIRILTQHTGEHPATGPDSAPGVWIDELSARLISSRFAITTTAEGTLLTGEEREADENRLLLGKPTPCVGRDAELGSLEAQLNGCIEESEARVVLFSAPPGIGKSRLRHEFLRRLEKRNAPLTQLLGRGELLSAGAPYGILNAALRQLCGLSGAEPLEVQRQSLRARIARHLPAAEQARVVPFLCEMCNAPFPDAESPMLQGARQEPKLMREGLRRAFLDFIAAECAAGPVLVVFDDLQWGDELTVSLMDDVLRAQAGAPLFVLVFARPEVRETFPKLWQGHRMQDFVLKGLSKKACERLILQVLGRDIAQEAVARVVEQSAGNALFLEELIRSLAEGKTEGQLQTVVAMLQARIGRLEFGVRRAVRAAAVFGQTFWRGGVAALLGLPQTSPEVESSLDALVESELIQGLTDSRLAGEKEYGFRHALVQDAAYGLLTASDLHSGHRLAAEFLEGVGEKDASVIADHFERGEDRPRASAFYLKASEASLKCGNYPGAVRQAERGIGCANEGECLGQLHGVVCYAKWLLNRYEGIEESGTQAMKLLRPGSRGWGRGCQGAIYAMTSRQAGNEMFDLLSLLLQVEPDPDARADYIETLGWVAPGLVVAVPESLMVALLTRIAHCVDLAAQSATTLRRYLHLIRGTMAMYRYPEPWTALKDFSLAKQLSLEAGDSGLALAMDAGASEFLWLELGDLDGARQRLLALEEKLLKSHDRIYLSLWRHLLAWVLCEVNDEGAWQQAAQLAGQLVSDTSGIIFIPTLGQGILARVALLRGQLKTAEEAARTAMQMFHVMPLWLTHTAPVQMRALIGLGRAADAVAVAEPFLRVLPTLGGAGTTEVEFRLAASESFQANGEPDRARMELRETLRQIKLRADDIPDSFWKNSYLTRNPYCARAQQLGNEWGLGEVGQ